MMKRRIAPHWGVLGVVGIAALVVSFGIFWRSSDDAEAVCGANPCMTVNNASPVVATPGDNFDITIDASGLPAVRSKVTSGRSSSPPRL